MKLEEFAKASLLQRCQKKKDKRNETTTAPLINATPIQPNFRKKTIYMPYKLYTYNHVII